MEHIDPTSSFPLLTIGIPTWNRANYLKRNLFQLLSEMKDIPAGLIEIIVSDNCSPDNTKEIVEEVQQSGLPIRYIRNDTNLGWALNFIQCFEQAKGKYVLLIGDDDVLVDDTLSFLINLVSNKEYGVICMKPYGFNKDFRSEHPGGSGTETRYTDVTKFLLTIDKFFTLTSALVLNKSLLKDVDPHQFIKTDLATFHLMLRATLAAKENIFVDRYLIASQRQNSFSYEFSSVFVNQFWQIVEEHEKYGLSRKAIRSLENKKLFTYYPFYLMDIRIRRYDTLSITYNNFKEKFKDHWLFKYWLEPILLLPRPLAITWGAITTFIGRASNGDLRRGIIFALNKLREKCNVFFKAS
jgi:glycosyltransferase involved in cell wall biosynthesis